MAAPAAALPVLERGFQDAAGVVKSVLHALERPIYTDVRTTTTRHQTEGGYLVESVRTKGYTIPLGVPVLVVGGLLVWEVGQSFASAHAKGQGASDPFAGAFAPWNIMNPASWINEAITAADGSQQNIAKPPTAMAALSQLVQNLLAPATLVTQSMADDITQFFANLVATRAGLKPGSTLTRAALVNKLNTTVSNVEGSAKNAVSIAQQAQADIKKGVQSGQVVHY